MNSALMILEAAVEDLHYFVEKLLNTSNEATVLHIVLPGKRVSVEAGCLKEFLKRGLLKLHALRRGNIEEAMKLFVDVDPSILILFLANSYGRLFIPLAKSKGIPIYSYALNCLDYVCEGFYSMSIDILLDALRRELNYAKRRSLCMVWNC